MPRTFWYHLLFASALGVVVALVTAGRATYASNTLCSIFSMPDRSLSLPALALFPALFGILALLTVRTGGSARSPVFLALYAAALFVPLLFLAARLWVDLLALLLLFAAARLLLDAAPGVRGILPPLLALLAAILLRGQLAPAAAPMILCLFTARGAKPALLFAALFGTAYAIMILFDAGGAGAITDFARVPGGIAAAYSVEGMLEFFRSSIEVQLLLGFTPFILLSVTGLTISGTTIDRAALCLLLALFLISAALFPLSMGTPGGARLQFMLLSLCAIAAANSGAFLLWQAAHGRRALIWSGVVGGLFLVPSLISFI